MKTRLCIPLATVLLVAAFPFAAQADDKKRKFIESLFRSVIESQTDNDPGNRVPVAPPVVIPHQGRPIPARPIPAQRMDPRMVSYQNYLGNFAGQTSNLATYLSRNQGIQGVRPLVPLALRLKSNCDVLVKNCHAGYGFDVLANQYRPIDSDWRALSYQLRSIGGLDRNTRDCITQLDKYSAETCKLLNIAPQFHRNAVLRNCHMQTAYLDSLLDAIDYELHHEGACQNLLSQGRLLKDQLIRLEPVILNEPYDQVVSKYSNYNSECRKYCASLYPLRKRPIERCLARVRAGSDSVFEELWVEPTLDRPYLGYLSDTMVSQLVSLFNEMSVADLVKLPPAEQQEILSAGNQLLGRCQSYCERVRKNAPLRDLVTDYSGINKEWTHLSGHFGNVKAEPVVNITRSIDGYCTEIRDILGVHSLYDYDRALALAASLEDMAGQMYSLSSRYGRYCRSSSLQANLGQLGNNFYGLSKSLHQQIASEAAFGNIQGQCTNLLTNWQSYGPALDSMPRYGLTPTRFVYISNLRRQINPVIAELAMMFAE